MDLFSTTPVKPTLKNKLRRIGNKTKHFFKHPVSGIKEIYRKGKTKYAEYKQGQSTARIGRHSSYNLNKSYIANRTKRWIRNRKNNVTRLAMRGKEAVVDKYKRVQDNYNASLEPSSMSGYNARHRPIASRARSLLERGKTHVVGAYRRAKKWVHTKRHELLLKKMRAKYPKNQTTHDSKPEILRDYFFLDSQYKITIARKDTSGTVSSLLKYIIYMRTNARPQSIRKSDLFAIKDSAKYKTFFTMLSIEKTTTFDKFNYYFKPSNDYKQADNPPYEYDILGDIDSFINFIEELEAQYQIYIKLKQNLQGHHVTPVRSMSSKPSMKTFGTRYSPARFSTNQSNRAFTIPTRSTQTRSRVTQSHRQG